MASQDEAWEGKAIPKACFDTWLALGPRLRNSATQTGGKSLRQNATVKVFLTPKNGFYVQKSTGKT